MCQSWSRAGPGEPPACHSPGGPHPPQIPPEPRGAGHATDPRFSTRSFSKKSSPRSIGDLPPIRCQNLVPQLSFHESLARSHRVPHTRTTGETSSTSMGGRPSIGPRERPPRRRLDQPARVLSVASGRPDAPMHPPSPDGSATRPTPVFRPNPFQKSPAPRSIVHLPTIWSPNFGHHPPI